MSDISQIPAVFAWSETDLQSSEPLTFQAEKHKPTYLHFPLLFLNNTITWLQNVP